MWQESHMGREMRESKVTRLERHVGRRSCGSSDMWTCQKMAQWGPIAEDDGLAGRKCEKGASPSTDKVESLSHDAATTCAFVMMRPIANTRLLLSQRISGCNRAPLWHFLPRNCCSLGSIWRGCFRPSEGESSPRWCVSLLRGRVSLPW